MTAYSLNVRVFWPLVTCGCTALLCLLQALRSKSAGVAAAWNDGAPVPLLKASLLLLLLTYLALRYRAWRKGSPGGPAKRRPGLNGDPNVGRPLRRRHRRRMALEEFYEQQLRLSPHVLGHSKAHVSLVVGEMVRAGKAPARLALRGDFVQVGSAYEQHKVRSPDAFDVLVPLRLPPRLELRVQPRPDQPGLRGAFVCALEVTAGAPDHEAAGGSSKSGSPSGRGAAPAAGPLSESLCVELPSAGGGRRHLSSALVMRWFQSHVQRCLGAVRSRLQERCRVSLAVGPGRPLALHIAPRSDYVCCHLSMVVRLIPAIPLGEALYLTPLPSAQPPAPAKLGAFWTLNVSKQEQRLLGLLREQAPEDSCHLKCLQILKGLRDLGGRSLEQPLSRQWSQVLSSYVLKTALFWVLLRGPLLAWEDQFLVERMEDLVLFLVEGLQRRRLMHLFLGNPGLPEALSLPKILKESPMVNLLADFDSLTLDRVAAQLLNTWKQAPKVIGMYSGRRRWRKHPV